MSDNNRRQLPPYVSYRSFWNFLDRLQGAIPARIDRSYWGDKFSGSTGTQLMRALRYLGLIDDRGIPTPLLRNLVEARDLQRDELMAQIARTSYSFFINGPVDYKTATYAQFEDILHANFQVNSEVARKCIKFFVDLATDARIPMSPFVIKKNRKARAAVSTRRTKNKPQNIMETSSAITETELVPNGTGLDKLLVNKFPNFDTAWPDEIKMKWFTAFDELIKRIPTEKNY
ncbi:MAG: DUF5343 domain-containing protein [Dehalococcoidales bacterium]|jgi:hypothetical protein|nr:DUF5343 domain-containing protein [Dehalococcoidales bacterium]MDD3264572.1 DUF5343 domain-containing protein [Dehalococcoidales bacterium]MDD4322214.1 DUF5343 domain-containing protein [Dehalococcoidales bacterium]MDD4794246.1 DUF5343 domain-containing protein [Dehalococcoidales bacterium]MDD5122659.1 DUF5343 domain-containing protein [Dehalococcoidales bacterium]